MSNFFLVVRQVIVTMLDAMSTQVSEDLLVSEPIRIDGIGLIDQYYSYADHAEEKNMSLFVRDYFK